MRHTSVIARICSTIGGNAQPAAFDPETTEILERTIDGVFERGYQAGLADREHPAVDKQMFAVDL